MFVSGSGIGYQYSQALNCLVRNNEEQDVTEAEAFINSLLPRLWGERRQWMSPFILDSGMMGL
jgi:hypothetical protein